MPIVLVVHADMPEGKQARSLPTMRQLLLMTFVLVLADSSRGAAGKG